MEKENKWISSGDPTESSLLVLAQKIGFHKDILEQEGKKSFFEIYEVNLMLSLAATGEGSGSQLILVLKSFSSRL